MFLVTASDDVTGEAKSVVSPGHMYKTHIRTLFVWGTFDSANFKLQVSPDGSEWFDVPNADTITAKTVVNVEFRAKEVRAVITGSTTTAIITAFLY